MKLYSFEEIKEEAEGSCLVGVFSLFGGDTTISKIIDIDGEVVIHGFDPEYHDELKYLESINYKEIYFINVKYCRLQAEGLKKMIDDDSIFFKLQNVYDGSVSRETSTEQ